MQAPVGPSRTGHPVTASAHQRSTDQQPLLQVRDLARYFDVSGGVVSRLLAGPRIVKAVDGISFDVKRNQSLAIVGESGSGKSTTARLIARLIEPTRGEILLNGRDLARAPAGELRKLRKDVQMVFQDPFSSLNPRMRVEELVGRSLTIHFGLKGRERRERVVQLLESVGLQADHVRRFPHEFSGGQRQRIAVARAIASEPTLLLADEAVSALDVSVQAQVIQLLEEMRQRLHLTLIFITHDLNVAEFISDQVALMYGGRIVEIGPTERIFNEPLHPYTRSLLDARPQFGRKDRPKPLEGQPTSPVNPKPGCRFAARCPLRIDACTTGDIVLEEKRPGQQVACIRVS